MPEPFAPRTLFDKKLQLAAFALGALGLFSANPLLTLASMLQLVILVKLLWRPGEPPILLFAMFYHWAQACALTLNADLQGLSLEAMGVSRSVVAATWLTLLGVLVIALGLRLGAGKSIAPAAQRAVTALATGLSVHRLFWASLAAIWFSSATKSVSFLEPGLRQVFLAIGNLHWVILFLFTFVVLAQRQGYRLLALVFGLEIVVGFLGYFSGFRDALIVVLLAAMTAPAALRGVRLRAVLSLGAAIVVLALVWTAIKLDYRDFLNRGTGDQVVLVPVRDRLDKLGELIGGLTWSKLGESSDAFVARLSYVHFFGESMQVVPALVPHENGKLWLQGLRNAIEPRLINPGKRTLDDSARTAYYTGTWVAGAREGASISLGYIAESYIDFGPILMYLPLFAWGLLVGWVHRVLVSSTRWPLWGYASATIVIYLNASVLESSNAKMVGGLILGFLVLWLAQVFLARRLLRLLSASGRFEWMEAQQFTSPPGHAQVSRVG